MIMLNKKICIVKAELGKSSETFVVRHIKYLGNGNNTIIYKRGDQNAFPNHQKFRVEKSWWYNYPTLFQKIVQIPHQFRYSYNRVPDKRVRNRIKHFLRAQKIDIILAEFGPHGCMMQPIAKELNLPLYTYFRGYDASKKLSDWKVRYAYRRMIPQMHGIIAVSPHLLANLKAIGVKWKKAEVIPSGVDTEFFTPGVKDPNLLLSVGRFVEKKSPQTTIKAFAHVLNSNSQLKLVMIGDGPLLKSCMSLAEELKAEKNIIFMGAQDHDVVKKQMSKASIFLLHSVTTDDGNTEGFPSVIQEAMASGTAVITTKHGGIPHFIHNNKNGIIVKEKDLSGFQREITKIISDNTLKNKLQNNARKTAINDFDQSRLYNRLEQFLNVK